MATIFVLHGGNTSLVTSNSLEEIAVLAVVDENLEFTIVTEVLDNIRNVGSELLVVDKVVVILCHRLFTLSGVCRNESGRGYMVAWVRFENDLLEGLVSIAIALRYHGLEATASGKHIFRGEDLEYQIGCAMDDNFHPLRNIIIGIVTAGKTPFATMVLSEQPDRENENAMLPEGFSKHFIPASHSSVSVFLTLDRLFHNSPFVNGLVEKQCSICEDNFIVGSVRPMPIAIVRIAGNAEGLVQRASAKDSSTLLGIIAAFTAAGISAGLNVHKFSAVEIRVVVAVGAAVAVAAIAVAMADPHRR